MYIYYPGADVNRATTTNDHTVLSLACAGGYLAVVELLLAHGAKPDHILKVMADLENIFLFLATKSKNKYFLCLTRYSGL